MYSLPHYLRACIAWALMPAAFWSGMQAPECECRTGEHRFYCPYMLGVAANATPVEAKKPVHSCCHRTSAKHQSSSDVATKQPGMHRSADSPCGHCTAVPSSFSTVTNRVEVPNYEDVVWFALSLTVDQAGLGLALANHRPTPFSDRLPTTDCVVDLCRLLI